jgi:katanin p60 ATPase-containing subunit A1
VPNPDLEARELMLRKYLPPELSEDLSYREFAEQLQSYSGSDIKLVCKEAAMKPLRRLLAEIEDIKLPSQD